MSNKLLFWLRVGFIFWGCHLISTTAMASCINFSGQYQSALEDGTLLKLKLEQKNCKSLFMEYHYSDGTYFTKTMIFDGAFRVIFDEPTFKTIESFSISDDKILFAAKLENKVTGSKNSLKGDLTQDYEGNIIENKTFYNLSGKPLLKVIILHTRITSQPKGL